MERKVLGNLPNQSSVESIAEILLKNEIFQSFPEEHQQTFLEIVRACEDSSFVQTKFEQMSQFRISQLSDRLANWVDFSTQVQLPLDVRKKELKVILANHLYRPVFMPTSENANKVKAQLENILERLESGRYSRDTKSLVESILVKYIDGIDNDMTPLFKYPLDDNSFEHLVMNINNDARMAVSAHLPSWPGGGSMFMDCKSKIESLIVQAYTEAIPGDIRSEVENLIKTAEEFIDAENLSETIVKIVQAQQVDAIKQFEKEHYEEFRRRAEMIQLEENGTLLEGDFEFQKTQSFIQLRHFFLVTGFILIFIVLIRISLNILKGNGHRQ